MEVAEVFHFRPGIVHRVGGIGAILDADDSDAENYHDGYEEPCYKDNPYLRVVVILRAHRF